MRCWVRCDALKGFFARTVARQCPKVLAFYFDIVISRTDNTLRRLNREFHARRYLQKSGTIDALAGLHEVLHAGR
jgi:hypothetical protein